MPNAGFSARLQGMAFRTLEQAGAWMGVKPRPLDADALIAQALRRRKRRDFSDRSFVEPLQRLLAAYEAEADLNLFGRLAARFDVLRCLDNLLLFDIAQETNPDIVRCAITRPIFITGLPRSGSTFLHTLLALDPANAVPRCWQTMYPLPLMRRGSPRDRRKEQVERQLRFFRRLSPELDGLHPLEAEAPQECTEMTAQVFQSLRFDTTHRVPSYQNWLESRGHFEAYRFHKRFLQHLDAQAPGRRWILKCPDHVFALDAIAAVYPDAELVFLHREPVDVLASVAKLTELLRRPFTHAIDREAIGRQINERWTDGAERMVAELRGPRAGRILNLHHRDVVSRPMETIASLYRHYGLTLSDDARDRMQVYLQRSPHGGYGRHDYDLGEFGLDPAALRALFARYRETFGIAGRPAVESAA